MLKIPHMVDWICSAAIYVEHGHGELLDSGASAILWVNREPLCSPKDFMAKSIGAWVANFPTTVEPINFLRS